MHSQIPGMPSDPEHPAHDDDDVQSDALDKTIADSFPTSDPPSTIPNPDTAAELSATEAARKHLLKGLPPGSWVALSIDSKKVLGRGKTRDEAERDARAHGHPNVSLVEVQPDTDAPLQAPDAA
jgi:hypothetical protein